MSKFEQMNEIARQSIKRAPAQDALQSKFSQMNEIAMQRLQGGGQNWSPEARTGAIIGQNLAKSPFRLADIPLSIAQIIAKAGPSHEYDVASRTYEEPFEGDIGISPDIVSNTAIEGLKKAGVNLDYVKPKNAWERGVNTTSSITSDFLTSGLVGKGINTVAKGSKILTPISKVSDVLLGTPKTGRDLTRMAGTGAAVGGGMAASEELGAPPGLSQAIGLAVPFSVPAAKSIGRAGKWAFSPSYRKGRVEKGAESLASSILKNQVGEENIPSILKDFENYEAPLSGYQPLTAETTNNIGLAQLQRAQYGHTPKLGEQQARNDSLIKEGLQSIESHPETMSDLANRSSPVTTGEELQTQLTKNIKKLEAEREAAHAPAQKAVEEHKPGVYASKTYELIDKQLQTAKGPLKSALNKVRDYLQPNNKINKVNTEGMSELLKKTINEKAGNVPSAHELKETISQIGDMIEVAKRNGANKRANVLMKVKESLLEDLVHTPVAEANKIYSEKSKPISKTKELFGRAAERDVYNQRYLMEEDAAARSIIDKAMQNPKYAEGFNEQFSNHPQSMKVTHGYINNDLHSKVINKNGKVNLDKLHSWKTSNPHAETIYPGINKKLENLQKKGLIDDLSVYFKDEKNISYDKLSKYITKNESMLRESFDSNQMKILEGSEKALAQRHAADVRAKAPGSPTASNLNILESIRSNIPEAILKKAASGSLTGKAGVWIYNFFRAAKKAKAEQLINAALADKDVAKLLLTKANDVKGLEKAVGKLKDKSYIPREIILNNSKEGENNDH